MSVYNQAAPEGKTKKGIFRNRGGTRGLSGPALDEKLRKPFPNMGHTPTGKEH